MSFAALQRKIDEYANPTVAGLDPTLELIPPHITEQSIAQHGETLHAAANALLTFNTQIIDAVCDVVPAVKPQFAFYERYGVQGFEALRQTAEYAKSKGLYVIADAKRGDIGSTAEAYSSAILGKVTVGGKQIAPFAFDAVTVNGYLGRDGILPFLRDAEEYDKALFVLVKTSNASSGDLQDIVAGGKKVYQIMGELIEELAGSATDDFGCTRIGAVVGATYPDELAEMRALLRRTFFLVPGYGAQGGAAADVKPAFDAQGQGAVINSSRAIIGAWKNTGNNGHDFAEAARSAALKMRGELREIMGF